MDTITCDICGKNLLAENLRYVVKIEIVCAYDTLELSKADTEKDYRQEIKKIIRELNNLTEEEVAQLEDSIYKKMRFDLCGVCRAKYLRNPLGKNDISARFSEN